MTTETRAARRPGRPARLSRDGVLAAALEVADAEGLEAVTMQRVASAIGAQPMSLYRHVANKDDLLDGLVDLVYAEIGVPSPAEPWGSRVAEGPHGREAWGGGVAEGPHGRHRGPVPSPVLDLDAHHDSLV